nr:saga-associated factor 73 [Quercus suber]
MNAIPSTIAKAFRTGRPMADHPEIVKCNHCKRPVMKHAMPGHIEQCLNKKQEKQRKKKEAKDARDAAARKERQGDSDEEDDVPRKTASKNGGLTASKKRKAIDDDEQGAPFKKKKKKDDLKAKTTKVKAPVDVEKQCGVELPQGGQCARSLTCKSHSMGLKRAVPGRSAPYDKLLMEYQRKNQAKLQKAAFDANAPNPDDDSLPSGPVDSEEEKDAVMSAISRSWGGRLIYKQTHVPLRSRYEYNRVKSMLSSALSGRGGIGLFNTGSGGGSSLIAGVGGGVFGSTVTATNDADSIIHARKGSTALGGRTMVAGGRKPSVASATMVT